MQRITIPEFAIEETQTRQSHFLDGENPTIFLAADLEQTFLTSLISQYLADYFGSPGLKGDIALILNTPEDYLAEIFRVMWRIPDLPTSWTQRFNDEPLPSQLVQNLELEFMDVSELEMSQTEADDIMDIINTASRMKDHMQVDHLSDSESEMELELGSNK